MFFSQKKICLASFVTTFCYFLITPFFLAYASSNNVILEEIEKSLLFDNTSKQDINFYRKENSRKSELVIDRSDNSSSDRRRPRRSAVDVVVVNIDSFENEIKEKENLAYNAALIGQYEVAIELYKQIIKVDSENYYAKFSLAVAYQKINQNSKAKEIYQELLSKDLENEKQIISNLLSILIDESPNEAIYFLTRLATQNPNSPYIVAQLALAHERVGNYQEAINFIKKAIFIDDENLEYVYNLAVLYDIINERDFAIRNYQKVIRGYNEKSLNTISLASIENRVKALKAMD